MFLMISLCTSRFYTILAESYLASEICLSSARAGGAGDSVKELVVQARLALVCLQLVCFAVPVCIVCIAVCRELLTVRS